LLMVDKLTGRAKMTEPDEPFWWIKEQHGTSYKTYKKKTHDYIKP
jgi:hypothetical protein